jgi:hypothetical protein
MPYELTDPSTPSSGGGVQAGYEQIAQRNITGSTSVVDFTLDTSTHSAFKVVFHSVITSADAAKLKTQLAYGASFITNPSYVYGYEYLPRVSGAPVIVTSGGDSGFELTPASEDGEFGISGDLNIGYRESDQTRPTVNWRAVYGPASSGDSRSITGGGLHFFGAGTPLSDIRILLSTGTMQSGQITLMGVKRV